MLLSKERLVILTVGVAVAGLAISAAGNARANLILNGNFSANAANYTNFPGYSSSPNPTSPTDWTVSVPANQGVNGPDTGFFTDTTNGGSPFAPSSTTGVNDFAFLQGAGNISQTITTTNGQAYTITYDAAERAGETADVLNLVVTNATDSTQIGTQSPAISDAAFNAFTLQFTATSASTTIEFVNGAPTTGPNAGETVDVSNVAVSPVPEPATLGLMGVGSLGLMFIGRRRARM